MTKVFKMTEADYREGMEEFGICFSCGGTRYEFTEPDAENYPCEECGESSVFGFEQALLMGRIEFTETID
jgi:hypothetical protein